MSTPTYDSLFEEATQIAAKYGMEEIHDGFNGHLVNILLSNHIEKVKRCETYRDAIALINESISHHLGAPVTIDDFIKHETDRHQLYNIYSQWRTLLLAEVLLSR